MEEMNSQESETKGSPVSQTALVTTSLVAFAFLCLAVAGLYYAWRLRAQSDELAAKIDQTNTALAETRSLSQGWLFRAGDSKGAEDPAFGDSGWRHVVVPHDWSIEDRNRTIADSPPNRVLLDVLEGLRRTDPA